MPSCSNRDHRSSNIDPGRNRSTLDCAAGGVSRAGSDVEDAHATLDTRGIAGSIARRVIELQCSSYSDATASQPDTS